MLTLSKILYRPVLVLDDGNIAGVVKDVFFDENLKTVLACDVRADNRSFILPIKNVISLNDVIVVLNSDALLPPDSSPYIGEVRHDLINTAAYSPLGVFKGSITDAEFTPSGRVVKLITADEEFSPASIGKIGDVIILKTAAKRAKKSFVPRPKRDYKVELFSEPAVPTVDGNAQTAEAPSTVTNVSYGGSLSIQSETLPKPPETSPTQSETSTKTSETASPQNTDKNIKILAEVSEILETKENAAVKFGDDFREPVISKGAFDILLEGSNNYAFDEDSHSPTRIICDYSFLLGRTLANDLKTYQGEIIAAKGSRITDETVLSARKAGKLVELTLLSVSANSK